MEHYWERNSYVASRIPLRRYIEPTTQYSVFFRFPRCKAQPTVRTWNRATSAKRSRECVTISATSAVNLATSRPKMPSLKRKSRTSTIRYWQQLRLKLRGYDCNNRIVQFMTICISFSWYAWKFWYKKTIPCLDTVWCLNQYTCILFCWLSWRLEKPLQTKILKKTLTTAQAKRQNFLPLSYGTTSI